jgi:hypothetical protein
VTRDLQECARGQRLILIDGLKKLQEKIWMPVAGGVLHAVNEAGLPVNPDRGQVPKL